MAISFVAAGAAWTAATSGTGFTLNKPSGLTDGDLMIAVLGFTPGATNPQRTVTVPSGWTKQDDVYNLGDNFPSQICVMTRAFVSGDPSTWTGSISSACPIRVTGVAAYRGVQSIATKGTSSTGLDNSYATATVNNASSSNWRVTTATYESGSLSYALNINEPSSRFFDEASNGSSDNVQVRISDSGAAIATGNTSRTVSRSANWDASTSWIAILQASSGTPSSGDMGATLPKLSATISGDIHDDGTSAVTLPSMTSVFNGYGSPPVGTGTFDCQLSPISADMAATNYTPASGTMDVTVLPMVSMVGETRVFGIRVIEVEYDDSRTIIVPSRGVDD